MKGDRYLAALDEMEKRALNDLNGHLDGDGPYQEQAMPSRHGIKHTSADGVTIIVGGNPLGVVDDDEDDD